MVGVTTEASWDACRLQAVEQVFFCSASHFQQIINFTHSSMYSQTCRFLSSLKHYLIKISSFWQTQLIKVIVLHSQLIKGRKNLTIRMSISITILHSHNLCELRTKVRNCKEMKDTIMWIISCVVLHNLLADLKNQWNEIYEEDEPYSAPVAEDDIDSSNNGVFGILHPICQP
ncbi:hypothetical protein VP01_1803g3 [Puccinia sorghi]|uniref:DDE Tnp4 domain-containing protein n=1 Tax=Puccinia sorghi TaxID=27349 RepID=A0A0L6VE91_9BASI|nr:hypothetical protein VP01_1803g3 [Puccinia sorghi]